MHFKLLPNTRKAFICSMHKMDLKIKTNFNNKKKESAEKRNILIPNYHQCSVFKYLKSQYN